MFPAPRDILGSLQSLLEPEWDFVGNAVQARGCSCCSMLEAAVESCNCWSTTCFEELRLKFQTCRWALGIVLVSVVQINTRTLLISSRNDRNGSSRPKDNDWRKASLFSWWIWKSGYNAYFCFFFFFLHIIAHWYLNCFIWRNRSGQIFSQGINFNIHGSWVLHLLLKNLFHPELFWWSYRDSSDGNDSYMWAKETKG